MHGSRVGVVLLLELNRAGLVIPPVVLVVLWLVIVLVPVFVIAADFLDYDCGNGTNQRDQNCFQDSCYDLIHDTCSSPWL